MASSQYRLLQLSLTELLQNMQEIEALNEALGWVRVSLILSASAGIAVLSFNLPYLSGRGGLSGNIHFSLDPQDVQPLFCSLLGSCGAWSLDRVSSKRRGKLRLRIKRVDATGLKQLILHIQAASN